MGFRKLQDLNIGKKNKLSIYQEERGERGKLNNKMNVM
jgi:hypothetical protein